MQKWEEIGVGHLLCSGQGAVRGRRMRMGMWLKSCESLKNGEMVFNGGLRERLGLAKEKTHKVIKKSWE
jgi:hypothetical protein